MSRTYECVICQSINSATQFHCRCCGTIPARYSWNGKNLSATRNCEIVVAHGAVRAAQHHQRLFLRTMPLDYYAQS